MKICEWSPLVTEHKQVESIENKIKEIYSIVSCYVMPWNSLGLLSGYGSIILFMQQYHKYFNIDYSDKIIQYRFNNYYKCLPYYRFGTFCDGLSGGLWLIRFLEKEGMLESEDINSVLGPFDDIIAQLLIAEYKGNNNDYLHGSLGMAYYLVIANNAYIKVLDDYVTYLDSIKSGSLNSGYRWLYQTFTDKTTSKHVYNLSLSHGMASLLSFLLKLMKIHPSARVEQLIVGIFNYYKKNINPPSYQSCFPKWIETVNLGRQESPLSWCYGDPGMAQSLYRASVYVEDREMINLSLEALVKCTKRAFKTEEACFCHGSSSLCHIFNRMYHATNNPDFKEAALYWLNDTIEKSKGESNYAGYTFFDTGDINNNYSLLGGLSGVGLALLSSIQEYEPLWDECVMLS